MMQCKSDKKSDIRVKKVPHTPAFASYQISLEEGRLWKHKNYVNTADLLFQCDKYVCSASFMLITGSIISRSCSSTQEQ